MKEMTASEIKSCSLDILLFIDQLCKKHNITYYLCGGTLLGAVRHQGFIPWDDDIDIMLPRKEYNKLLECFPSDDKYVIRKPLVDKGYPYPYAKVMDNNTIKYENFRSQYLVGGIDVDVFPIDALPSDNVQCIAYFKEIEKIGLKLDFLKLTSFKGRNIMSTTAKYLCSYYYRAKQFCGLISTEKVLSQYVTLAQRYNGIASECCGITSISHYGIKERNISKDYVPTVLVSFENHQFPAPGCYKTYLSNLYGKNFMELPPVDKRVTHHDFKAYWR